MEINHKTIRISAQKDDQIVNNTLDIEETEDIEKKQTANDAETGLRKEILNRAMDSTDPEEKADSVGDDNSNGDDGNIKDGSINNDDGDDNGTINSANIETQIDPLEKGDVTNEDLTDDLVQLSFTPGEIINRSIAEEMRKNYLDYSMSVIVSRALPDVKDGLKPSQRRILVAMNDLNLTPSAHFRKSAKIAGDTTGNYHPHGDQVIYPTMVKLAQDFSVRYTLVNGQGNFGSIDGDMPAAMRYTEAKMTKITLEMLRDIDKGTVTFSPNYDATRTEPNYLPTLFPNLVCNGSDGIAVGMATKIPAHNLGEVVDALRAMIAQGNKWKGSAIYNKLRLEREGKEIIPKVLNATPADFYENYVPEGEIDREAKVEQIKSQLHDQNGEDAIKLYPEFETDLTNEDIMKYIPGPDFPTGGIIYDKAEILNAYTTGRGRILTRARASIEEGKGGRFHIIVTEIPYQVNKSVLITNIADLVKDKRIEGIADIRDESNREGMRIVIILKKDVQPKVILNKLYKYSALQNAFNANMISLVDGEPELLSMTRMLELFLGHRLTIVIRRHEYELAQNRYEAHILAGLLKALDLLDEIIALIRASKTQEDAKSNLITKFEFTEVQAQAILEMQLRKLAALERQKLEDRNKEILATIESHNKILSDTAEVLKIVDQELADLKEKHGDPRRTKVVAGKVDDISEEDTVASEETFINISRSGYIKRLSPDTYRVQKRGGKGVIGATTKEDDYIQHALSCNTHDELFLFTNKGKVFNIKAYQIPESSRTAKGIPIVNLIQIEQGELITGVLNKDSKNLDKDSKKPKYLFMATERGVVKKTELTEFGNIRASGLIAIKLDAGDESKWVAATSGDDDIILITKKGKCIRFSEADVRPMGRNTRGVTGIKFKSSDDCVISMSKIEPQEKEDRRVLTISENAFGKTTSLSNYERQRRGGTGLFTFRVSPKTGNLVVTRVITPDNPEIVVMSTRGQVIRAELKAIPDYVNRQTSGVRIMNMNEGDTVAAIAILPPTQEDDTPVAES